MCAQAESLLEGWQQEEAARLTASLQEQPTAAGINTASAMLLVAILAAVLSLGYTRWRRPAAAAADAERAAEQLLAEEAAVAAQQPRSTTITYQRSKQVSCRALLVLNALPVPHRDWVHAEAAGQRAHPPQAAQGQQRQHASSSGSASRPCSRPSQAAAQPAQPAAADAEGFVPAQRSRRKGRAKAAQPATDAAGTGCKCGAAVLRLQLRLLALRMQVPPRPQVESTAYSPAQHQSLLPAQPSCTQSLAVQRQHSRPATSAAVEHHGRRQPDHSRRLLQRLQGLLRPGQTWKPCWSFCRAAAGTPRVTHCSRRWPAALLAAKLVPVRR